VLCDAGQAGMNGPDIRRATDHGDYRKRICELIEEDGIPVDRARVPSRNWKRYTLKVSPGEAVRTFLLRPHRKGGEGKDTPSGGGSDERALRNVQQGPVDEIRLKAEGGKPDKEEEAVRTHQAASLLGKRSGVKRKERSKATAPGGKTWAEYNKERQTTCLN